MQNQLLDPITHQLGPDGPFVTLRPANVDDPLEMEQLMDISRACSEHITGAFAALTAEQLRRAMSSSDVHQAYAFVAEVEMLEGGTHVAATGSLFLPLKENLNDVFVDGEVHPALRGRGIGRLLWDHLVEGARRTGRTRITCFSTDRAGAPIEQSPGSHLAESAGLTKVSQADIRVLALPVADTTLDALAAQSMPHAAGYELRTIIGALPEELLVPWGQMLRQLEIDDPDEDYESEIPDYTPERIRAGERRLAERGYERIAVVALDADGNAAGNTFADVHIGEGSTLGIQQNTLVMPGHRGHRLGLAMKVLLHRALTEHAPHLTRVQTWNSHINDHMGRINEQLGYEKAGVERCFQGSIPEVAQNER